MVFKNVKNVKQAPSSFIRQVRVFKKLKKHGMNDIMGSYKGRYATIRQPTSNNCQFALLLAAEYVNSAKPKS